MASASPSSHLEACDHLHTSLHKTVTSGHRGTEAVGRNDEDGLETIEKTREGVELTEPHVEGDRLVRGVVRRGSPICLPGDDESSMAPVEKKVKKEDEEVEKSIDDLPNEMMKKVIGYLDVRSLWNLRLNNHLMALVEGELTHIPSLLITSKRGVLDDGCTLQTPLYPSVDRAGLDFLMRLQLLKKYTIGELQLEVAIENPPQFRFDVWRAVADLHADTVISNNSYHTAKELGMIVRNKKKFDIATPYRRNIFSFGYLAIIKMMYKREIILEQFAAPVAEPIFGYLVDGIRGDPLLRPLLVAFGYDHECIINESNFSMNLSGGGIDVKVNTV